MAAQWSPIWSAAALAERVPAGHLALLVLAEWTSGVAESASTAACEKS